MLEKLTLGKKLGLIGALGVISLIVVAMITYRGLNKIGNEIVEIAEFQVPLNKAITELEKDILEEEILTYELIIASKDVHSKEFKDLEVKITKLETATDKQIILAEELVKKAILYSQVPEVKAQYIQF